MAFLTLTSTNPNLSHIVCKNPNTILTNKAPYSKELRKGELHAWFANNNHTFKIWFKDHVAENSFSDRSEFEYLDTTRYSGPYIPIAMITAVLATASSKQQEHDVEANTEGVRFEAAVKFSLNVARGLANRFVETLARSGDDTISCQANELAKNQYEIIIKAPTVFQVLNLTQLLACLASMEDENTYIPLPSAGVKKYLSILNRVKAPYQLRYLFCSRAITNPSLFESLKADIQADGMMLQYGNTQVQRHRAVRAQLITQAVPDRLVDIGCGELYHSVRLANMYESVVAIEADTDVFEDTVRIAKKKQILNLNVRNDKVDAAWVTANSEIIEGADVLLSEVLEHNSKDDAMALMKALVVANPFRILITVPCRDFNVNYNPDPFWVRHPGHIWEPTLEEMRKFCEEIGPHKFDQIGDRVGDYTVGIMATFGKI